MAKYRCSVCGYIYDEEAEGAPFSTLSECPVCHQPHRESSPSTGRTAALRPVRPKAPKLDYPKEFIRNDPACRYMKEIHEMAVSGKKPIGFHGHRNCQCQTGNEILILGAQLDPMPLEEKRPGAPPRPSSGRGPKKPLILEKPGVTISHMSLRGAFQGGPRSRWPKVSAMAHSAMCSGEGGIFAGRDAGRRQVYL